MSWRLVSDDPYLGVRRYVLDMGDQEVWKTEYYAKDAFFEANQAEFRESDGHKFGEGKRVASIPMHIWARQIAPAQQNGDDGYIKKWLNDLDNRAYRTFKGRV